MILIFGGTTEGRIAIQTLEEAGKTFYYSTKGDEQDVLLHNGIRLQGAMDAIEIETFCAQHHIKLLIDAAHPFATQLHETLEQVSVESNIPVIRFERIFPKRDEEHITWCRDYDDAIEKIQKEKIFILLALTGVQTIGKLKPLWQNACCYFRILDRDSSRKLARERMDEAVQGIQSALNWRGVSLWPGGEPDVLVTAYAADFLLTMRESGAALPGGLLAEVFGALENALDRVPDSLEEGRAQAYGLWVLTREGRITTQAMEQLVSQLEDRFPEWRKDVASTLLAGSCAIMRMNDDARHLIALYQAPGPDFQARGYLDALGVQALRASVLARHFPDMLDTQRTEMAQELLDVLEWRAVLSDPFRIPWRPRPVRRWGARRTCLPAFLCAARPCSRGSSPWNPHPRIWEAC